MLFLTVIEEFPIGFSMVDNLPKQLKSTQLFIPLFKDFTLMKYLKKHIAEVHKDYKPFVCKLCPAKFYQGGHLRRKPFENLNMRNYEIPAKPPLFHNIKGLVVYSTRRIP